MWRNTWGDRAEAVEVRSITMAICDDDRQARTSFQEMVRSQWKDEHTILQFESGQDLMNHYREKKEPIDMILLDIYMCQLDGIETAKLIRKVDEDTIIIFFTSSLNHAIAGYGVHAFGYLVKPVERDILIDTLHEALAKIVRSEKTITIRCIGNEYHRLKLSQLTHTVVDGNHLFFHMSTGEIYRVAGTLKEYWPRLGENGFVQLYPGSAANLSHILEINSDRRSITLNSGAELSVARRAMAQVTSAFFDRQRGDSV